MTPVDDRVPVTFYSVIDIGYELVLRLCAVIILSPAFTVPGALLIVVGFWMSHIYMKADLSLKRELNIAKAPVMGHIGAAVAGLGKSSIIPFDRDTATDKCVVSIRAYNAQEAFKREAHHRIDTYTSVYRTYMGLYWWIAVRGELLAGAFSSALAAYLVYGAHRDASEIGFSLAMASKFKNC